MLFALIVLAISIVAIIVVAVLLGREIYNAKSEAATASDATNTHIKRIVNQINDSQQYAYAYDKRQESQIYGVNSKAISAENAASDVRNQMVADKTAAETKFSTKALMVGDFASSSNIVDPWADGALVTGYAKPGQVGASFGSEGWSHFPWKDGNTYIRPGANGKDINVGDILSANVNLGSAKSQVNVKGPLNVAGETTTSSVGRKGDDSDWFRINDQNEKNNTSKGTAMYQGLALNAGGGLSVGEWAKVPEGQVYVRDALKVRTNGEKWLDTAAISTWTPNSNLIGASFGGPEEWSFFPYTDGNTYVRSGNSNGTVFIGDRPSMNVSLGNPTGAININGRLATTNGVDVNKSALAPMIEKNFGQSSDRYGVDASSGKMRTYTASAFPGSVSLSRALANNQFDDVLTVNPDRSTNITGPLMLSDRVCINSTCLVESDLAKIKALP
jgi:hypothetical protein